MYWTDPEGTTGYNAFVNEPAEPTARITLDEEANAVDFMDQAQTKTTLVHRMEERDLYLIMILEILSRADASTRADLLRKVEFSLMLNLT